MEDGIETFLSTPYLPHYTTEGRKLKNYHLHDIRHGYQRFIESSGLCLHHFMYVWNISCLVSTNIRCINLNLFTLQ